MVGGGWLLGLVMKRKKPGEVPGLVEIGDARENAYAAFGLILLEL